VKPQILFAISPAEFDLFFGEIGLPQLSAMKWDQLTAAPVLPEDLVRVVAEQRPQILVTGWSTPVLPAAIFASQGGSVEYVCNITGEVKRLITRELIVDGLLITNWGSRTAEAVAEHALLLLLAALRNLGRWPAAFRDEPSFLQRAGTIRTRRLYGKKVAIHGFGAIAQALIRLLRPFDNEIVAYSEGVPPDLIRVAGVVPADSLAALFRGSAIVVSCEALTETTRGTINREVLDGLPREAIFVNVGRGAVVDENALVEVALAKELRVAADVFVQEPLSLDSALRRLPHLIASPHVGGPSSDMYPELGQYAVENIRRFIAGEKVEALVTPEILDRST